METHELPEGLRKDVPDLTKYVVFVFTTGPKSNIHSELNKPTIVAVDKRFWHSMTKAAQAETIQALEQRLTNQHYFTGHEEIFISG